MGNDSMGLIWLISGKQASKQVLIYECLALILTLESRLGLI
jgi:hypothetical protein